MHTFRLEWQPGDDGYLHWYIDGVFKYGIEQDGLNFMKTKIPNEPSSIIFNTAISTSWGFPTPPPGCTNYDCKTYAGQCGFYPGFCQQLPAKYLIDHVRVFQRVNDSRQTVGCDPEGYPTTKFIEAFATRYKNFADVEPLLPIQNGGGHCTQSSACGIDRNSGECVNGKCRCEPGWTGPRCLVRVCYYYVFFLIFLANI
jgi:hypothetical protein